VISSSAGGIAIGTRADTESDRSGKVIDQLTSAGERGRRNYVERVAPSSYQSSGNPPDRFGQSSVTPTTPGFKNDAPICARFRTSHLPEAVGTR
jgi:hypothetical protein